tara:strand:+ start:533 stop:829 length:297 start_codon:yes stop_codon:yes gene_type:complete
MKIVWTRQALERLEEIEDFISRDSSSRAVKFIDKLIKKGDSLESQPKCGRVVPEFGSPDIREIIEGNYRIVYRLKKSRIEILTVFEGHRLFSKEDVKK